MRNKLFAGALALAMTCTTVFSGVAPATVKAASVIPYRHRQQKTAMFTAMQD